MWLLVLLIPIFAARWLKHGRLWTQTPLNIWLLAFLALLLVNMVTAPYTRGWIMLSRPLLGIALYTSFVELGREQRNLNRLIQATTWLALLVGFLSVTATQWNSKSTPLTLIIDAIPTLHGFPGAEQGFNANEIAGAISWLQPLIAGIILFQRRERQGFLSALVAFMLLTVGILLGQSRLALSGVGVALGFLTLALVRGRPQRVLAITVLVAAVGLEFLIISDTQMAPGESGLSARDEQSLIGRQDIWESALNILRDYPMTGVGMSMFRDGRVRAQYPAPGYAGNILPHAHNEWLQIGADLGIPGLVIFAGWHITAGFMLLSSWKIGDDRQKILTASVFAGMLAHGVFGLADAITLWDRFIFLYWWLLGLVGAQFTRLKYAK
jgi:O-antigen ligase